MSSYVQRHGGLTVFVDRQPQRLQAEIPEEPLDHFAHQLPVATLADARVEGFVPALALSAKAKAFDDDLYARLEHLAHHGAGRFAGLYAALDAIRAALPEGGSGRGLLDAANHLAGHPLPSDDVPRREARRWLARFLPDTARSRPTGFYSGSRELSSIFRHDRLLQEQLDPETATALRGALASTGQGSTYARYLDLVAAMTGPLARPSLLSGESPAAPCVLPPSDSLEARLVHELFGGASVPEGFELGPEIVARIRDGRLDATPGEDDGWYGRQLFAASALLDPESDRLEVGPRYRAHLEEAFLGQVTLNRETHIKQLMVAAAGAAGAPTVCPRLSVEPVPNHYSRVADAYAWLRSRLEQLLGRDTVASEPWLHPMTIRDALVEQETLFRGAAAVSWEELGRAPSDSAASAAFRAWQSRCTEDPAWTRDVRVAVPQYQDLERGTYRVWVTLGFVPVALNVRFTTPPDFEVRGTFDAPWFDGVVGVRDVDLQILSLAFLECDVKRIPTRDQLRAVCDEQRTPEAIREALSAR